MCACMCGCVYGIEKNIDSIKFIAQGAFRGMIHEVYLMLGIKSEEKKGKIGHFPIVILLIRLVGQTNSSFSRLVEGCRGLTTVCCHLPTICQR